MIAVGHQTALAVVRNKSTVALVSATDALQTRTGTMLKPGPPRYSDRTPPSQAKAARHRRGRHKGEKLVHGAVVVPSLRKCHFEPHVAVRHLGTQLPALALVQAHEAIALHRLERTRQVPGRAAGGGGQLVQRRRMGVGDRASRARLRFDSSLAKLSGEVNQTLGSPGLGRSSPRAIAIVRAFMSSYEAIPTFSVFMSRLLFPASPIQPLARTRPAARRRPCSHRA